MKKTGIITLIIILVMCILSLLGLMIFIVLKGNNFKTFKKFDINNAEIVKEETYDANSIRNIEILTASSDIEIKKSEDDKIKIVQYGNDDEKIFSSSNNNSELKIESDDHNNFCFFICFGSESYLEIYIPTSYENKIDVKTTSGDIKVDSSLNLSSTQLKTISGDMRINANIKTGNLILETTSGDIETKDVTTNNYKINTVSGEIDVDNLVGEGNIKTTSGDIDINNFKMLDSSNFKSVSGEINIGINDETDCEVSISTVSGDKNIKNGTIFKNGKYNLDIETVSGDIDITKR